VGLLLNAMRGSATGKTADGQLGGAAHELLIEALQRGEATPRLRDVEQTNSVVNLGDQVLFKLFRQAEAGINSELEIGTYLTERAQPVPVPRTLGSLGYRKKTGEYSVIALAQEYVPNEGTAWDLTLQRLSRFCDEMLARPPAEPPPPRTGGHLAAMRVPPPEAIVDLSAGYLADARQLGRRTAELHAVLASEIENEAFIPEPFSAMHANSIYQWSHALLARTTELLARNLPDFPPATRETAERVVTEERHIDDLLRRVTRIRFDLQRIRCHGDLHLGQVLHTGTGFVFIDWEGEPGRTLGQRRYKRGALRDVMGMIRSFSYASETVLRSERFRAPDVARVAPWVHAFRDAVSGAYLAAYLETAAGSLFVPKSDAAIDALLDFYELEKVIYEVHYELNHRPDWLDIPLSGLLRVLSRAD
jgi:maltose alpha-D-glucosyltransferase/alpha-amylase